MKFHSLRLTAGEKDLEEWNRWWCLQGEQLECKSCGWAQWPIQSNTPFTHAPDCSMPAPYDHFPWRDLGWIAAQMKRDMD
jgi:hypothetical protein